jgi:hypothetical protein
MRALYQPNEAPAKHLDAAGMSVSVLCAVHCIVVPLLAGTLTAAGIGWVHNEVVEWLLVAVSCAIGVYSLFPAFHQRHGKKRCLGLFSLGMGCILFGKFFRGDAASDTPFVVFGAVMIIAAHTTNQYLCRSCRCPGTD